MSQDQLVAWTLSSTLARVRRGYMPPPELTVSEFADKEIIVTSGPFSGTRWRTDFAPYQRGIMDVFHEPGVEIAVVMGSSQWGKTACAVNVIAYHIAHDPGPILVVEPTVDPMAKDFARTASTPSSTRARRWPRSCRRNARRMPATPTLLKTYRGGALAIGGANSAASLASRSVRLLIGDEIDRWPAELEGEGSTIAIALKRTTAYKRRRRVLLLSSPTLVGAPVHAWFKLRRPTPLLRAVPALSDAVRVRMAAREVDRRRSAHREDSLSRV
jgi:phage terminase large subunit GpA-like protein